MIFEGKKKRLQIISGDRKLDDKIMTPDQIGVKPRLYFENSAFKVLEREFDHTIVGLIDSDASTVIDAAENAVRPLCGCDVIVSCVVNGGRVSLLNVSDGGVWSRVDKHNNSRLHTLEDGVIRMLSPAEASEARARAGIERRAAKCAAPIGPIVVTRHMALVDYLIELGLVDEGVEVIRHVSDHDVIRGRRVLGNLPLHLAAMCEELTVIPIKTPPHKRRGDDLSLEEIRQWATAPKTYIVRSVPTSMPSARKVK